MSEKTNKWELILKEKKEVFQILEHVTFNLFYPPETYRDNQNLYNKSSTPFVKKDKNGIKHVEVGYFTPQSSLKILGEKEWLKKSVNIFNSALVKRTTVVLEKNKDKVKLSLFNFVKSRSVGHKYFAKQSIDKHITFNLKTKNFYLTTSQFKNKRKVTNTTKNDFFRLRQLLPLRFENNFADLPSNTRFSTVEHLKLSINPFNFIVKLIEELDLDIVPSPIDAYNPGKTLSDIIMSWFVKIREIKTPNQYEIYLSNHYPGIKKLRKNGMNLIKTILKEKGLSGKFYNKLLNIYPTCNLTDIVFLKNLIGDNYVKEINLKILSSSNNFQDNKYDQTGPFPSNYPDKELSVHEKKNIVSIYNTSNPDTIISFIDLLIDHINMKMKLKTFGITKRIKSKTRENFSDEHHEWSTLLHQCERNVKVNYYYPVDFINHMEIPIVIENNTYFVTLLKTDSDYFNEGQIQHHCVRTYLDRYKSIIVSVRKNNLNSCERMTCEFVLGHTPKLIQSRMKYNDNPKNDWEVICRLLTKEFLDYVCKVDENKVRPIIKISNTITNYVEIKKYSSETDSYVGEENNIFNTTKDYLVEEDLPF